MACDCENVPATSSYGCTNCSEAVPCPTASILPCANPNPCDGELSTDCVNYEPVGGIKQSCAGIKRGDTLTTVIQKLDARICACCGSGVTVAPLLVFYVDGNNTNTGDGSILNPYKTIELAYNAVLGTGTVVTPQYMNVAITVAAFNYSTSQNIYLGYVTYNFAEGTTVNFTGTGYFVDTSSVGASPGIFKVTGGLVFKTSSGGFLRNQGATISGGAQKQMYIQAHSIWGNTNASGTSPLIIHNQTTSNGYGALVTSIHLQAGGSIYSAWETNISLSNGGTFILDLGGGQLGYGVDQIVGAYTGVAGRNLLKYTCNATTVISTTDISNGTVYALNNTDMFDVSGYYVYFKLSDLRSVIASLTVPKPDTFINIGAMTPISSAGGDHTMILKGIYLNSFAFATITVIKYSGSGNLSDLEMRECVLYNNLGLSTTILLGASTTGSTPSTNFNIIRNRLNLTQLPAYASNTAALAGGLLPGDVYKNNSSGTAIGTLYVTY